MHSNLDDMINEATTTSDDEEEGDTFSFDNEGIFCEGGGVMDTAARILLGWDNAGSSEIT